jgi:hypothetical protein
MASESVHPSQLAAADEGFDTASVALRFPAAVAVVHGFTGNGIGENHSAAALFDCQASAVCSVISCLGHIAGGKGERERLALCPKTVAAFNGLTSPISECLPTLNAAYRPCKLHAADLSCCMQQTLQVACSRPCRLHTEFKTYIQTLYANCTLRFLYVTGSSFCKYWVRLLAEAARVG